MEAVSISVPMDSVPAMQDTKLQVLYNIIRCTLSFQLVCLFLSFY